MNTTQQQIASQWNQDLQQAALRLQQLLEQANAGCAGLIAQNPTDLMPMSNAVGAISHQVSTLRDEMEATFDARCESVDDAGDPEPAHSQMSCAYRAFRRWADETWSRFTGHVHLEQYRAMWPHVQAAMLEPRACTRCGAPLRRATPHKHESIACQACQTINQVVPEGVIGQYFMSMPHVVAEGAAMEKQQALRKFMDDWDDYLDTWSATDDGDDSPEEPIERLKQREQLELAYWTTYAETRVRNEDGSPEDVRTLIDSRMKGFYDDMNRNDVWRKAHGIQAVAEAAAIPAHLAGVDEWGPLDPHQNPNALEDDWMHEMLLEHAQGDPAGHAELLRSLGYRDGGHRAHVHATFRRHYDEYLSTDAGQALINRAVMRATNERISRATATGAASGLLDPIEGVSVQAYASLQVRAASVSQDELVQLLAQHQMDLTKWARVSKAWIDRMSRDTTGAIASEYAKAFAGGGQYGAMGAAAADVMAAGQMGAEAPQAAELVSFERYCEISGAMSAWSNQGKDVNAGLHQRFQMSAMDFSNVSMYWSQKLMADMSLYDRQTALIEHYEAVYEAMP